MQREWAAAAPPVGEYDSGMSVRRSRRGVVVAGVVLGVLLVAAAVTLLLRPGGSPADQPPRAQAPAVAGPVSVTPSTVATSEASPVPTTAPDGVRWELFEGVALPTSASAGPTRVDGAVHAGFAHTPTGALLADAQIGFRSLVTPSLTGLRRVAQDQLVAGPGKTAYLNLIASLTDNAAPAAGYSQIVGFRFITYDPDLAVISLATRGRSGVIQVGTDTLRWVDGDWKLQLPPSGLQQPQTVPDIAGYVPWHGVG